ncbi:redoxin domain-containing protein [Pontibacillus yanchengensis]|uniref:Redoxin domain-containing protein n=2 Tax=Pontibacillus yanchengensis TaxID=462910 RepID=A0ACC7VAP2_9BACI|nr:TlpA disulfide reductase family protein [Pontibacillus yanchengensis]MYL33271.1 redoxin domain-containing protein [Pontibacillus yanchengensis]MYL51893.1 redoxin domain-containing protein [Pontibacillus yanchengensis]
MIKRVIAGGIMLILFGFTIYSVLDASSKKDQASQNGELKMIEADYSKGEGASISPPDAPEGLRVGEKAPDVELQTLEGETVHLSDFEGENVFLNFWATWCPPCKVEMPEMQKFHEEYGDEVTIIAVNATRTESSKEKVKQFIEEEGYTFKVLLDPEMEANSLFRAQALPTTYFIGKDGTIQEATKVGPMSYNFMKNMKNKMD